MTADRNDSLKHIISPNDFQLIENSKILLVGAGGIGSEVAKNLVMMGFKNITIIDLDTIDLSNLNRQFLFQNKHIKMPKATVAKQSVQEFNPNAKLLSFHASIFDAQFTPAFFASFSLILNALDNLAARRHVNKLAVFTGVPVLESGSAGYLGQVTTHLSSTACFDCTAHPRQEKTYPVCTIRSTPSEMIHCIVWAKSYLFQNLFGVIDSVDPATDDFVDTDLVELTRQENQQILKLRNFVNQPKGGREILAQIFNKDIAKVCTLDSLWKSRPKPIPLKLEPSSNDKAWDSYNTPKVTELQKNNSLKFEKNVWTTQENISIFLQSMKTLSKEMAVAGDLAFDKDNDACLSFITATANLRAIIYNIPPVSRFECKQMAGNIIPSIATSNAIIGGMIVMNAIKVLTNKSHHLKDSFLTYGGDRKHYILNQNLQKKNPDCAVCSGSFADLRGPMKTRLRDFIDRLEKSEIKGEITIQIGSRLVYDVDFPDLLESTFEGLGLVEGSEIYVTNDSDDPETDYGIVFYYHPTGPKTKLEIIIGKQGLKKRKEMELIAPEETKKIKTDELQLLNETGQLFLIE